jgi:hypothetical protein
MVSCSEVCVLMLSITTQKVWASVSTVYIPVELGRDRRKAFYHLATYQEKRYLYFMIQELIDLRER